MMINPYDMFKLFIHILYFYIAYELIVIVFISNCHLCLNLNFI